MTGPGVRIEDRLAEALTTMPDLEVDLRAARTRLQRRTGRAARTRRVCVVLAAAVVALAVVVVGGGRLVPRPVDNPVAPQRLASGLPVGVLHGNLYYTDPAHGVDGTAAFYFVVGADGRGTYHPPHSGQESWPVRFVGRTAGHVVVRRVDEFCGLTDDLALDFTVRDDDSVRITGAVIGRCSIWPKIAGTSGLPGTLLIHEDAPAG